jgi:GTP-binding protein Era
MKEAHQPHRAGFVALVGRPSVGKSTLLNALAGHKLAAATPRPQTTRRRLRAIVHHPAAQVVLVDTPGLFDAALEDDGGRGGFGELGLYMSKETKAALADTDVVLWLEEPRVGKDGLPQPLTHVQEVIAKRILHTGKPCVLVLNKVDTVEKGKILLFMDLWKNATGMEVIVPVSALRADGLDRLLGVVVSLLPESPALYPENTLTDASERDVSSELIREKVMLCTGEEIPYATAVEIERFDETRRQSSKARPGIVEIDAAIHVEREGQKAIVVGRRGQKSKEIGTRARQDLERLLGCKVMLRLFVKVTPRWTRSAASLKQLGFR